ncbi:MAG: glucoamylase family protein [Sumerlaeia bacterium]
MYDIVLELVSHSDAEVDAESLHAFVAAYQTVTSLQLGELWAIPIMLRLVLIENLKGLAIHLGVARNDRLQADYWIDRLQEMSRTKPADVVIVVAEMAQAEIQLSPAFVAEFCKRITRQNPTLQIALEWLTRRLGAENKSVEQLVNRDTQMQAANQVAVRNSIASMRLLGIIDWKDFVEGLSIVEKVLRTDPARIYHRMDFATRDHYRQSVGEIARFGIDSEEAVAREAIALAEAGAQQRGPADRSAHVGYYLIDKGKPQLEQTFSPRWSWRTRAEKIIRRLPLPFYVGSVCLQTLLLVLGFLAVTQALDLTGWKTWLLALPFTLAATQMAKALVDWASGLLVEPRSLPRLDFSKGIPPEGETCVVIPTMLSSPEAAHRLIESLEIHYLTNRDEHLHFALLTDFPDAESETLPTDDALLRQVCDGIQALQRRYAASGDSIFYLFHRPRRWNPAEGVWMGYERKRGKLEEFNGYLRGQARSAFSVVLGNTEILPRVKYVITLDTDTQLPRDVPHLLVGALCHPLNRAEVDPIRKVVTRGYGILQPRVSISLPTAGRSWYVRLTAGDSGIDPYTRAVSNTYQDLFDEGSFIGKGIYDVDAFQEVLEGRLPENKILSHDLIEACHARSALMSDVELFEDFPYRYNVDVDRRRRWIRGDWQILQWIFPFVPGKDTKIARSGLSTLSRFKIFDNLRRSAVSTAQVLILLGGWVLFPQAAWVFPAIVLLLLLFPEMASTGADLYRRSKETSRSLHLRLVAQALGKKLMQVLLALTFLLYDAAISIGAIIRSLVRVFITRKRLLEWRTSGDAERASCKDLRSFYRTMWVSPAIAVAVACYLGVVNPVALVTAAPILFLWIMAPWVGWYISQPLPPPSAKISAEQQEFLHLTARKTWWYFEKFATATENWLPPDNYQEESLAAVAPRTSPTNIGFSLLANVAAHDFGYISTGRLIQRTRDTLLTLRKLEKHRGHFFNWYDTRTLLPLPPRYVSAVDSGNLAGMLLTLAGALRELSTTTALNPQRVEGLRDTLAILRQSGDAPRSLIASLEKAIEKPRRGLKETHALFDEIQTILSPASDSPRLPDGDAAQAWIENLSSQCEDFLGELAELQAALGTQGGDGLEAQSGEQSLDALADGTGSVGQYARMRIESLDELALECDELARMEWGFLFEPTRKLFAVGYNVDDQRLDSSYYDLLASEARLTSYIAIAQGAVHQEHWFSLGRLLVAASGKSVLASWSGSMFEYLMPHLIMPSYPHTLLDGTCAAAVDQQISYGNARGVPWGISESGYNRTDVHLNYQYRAFGIPGIGLKRGLEDDLVVAPYASALALLVAPRQACENLQLLAREGRTGDFGFYEAVDYTPSRIPPRQKGVVVRSFMAHHQGMILLSLLHLLKRAPMQKRFALCPTLRTIDLLLHERMPTAEGTILQRDLGKEEQKAGSAEQDSAVRICANPNSPTPEVHLLSNERYHVAITSAGAGFSSWKNLAVTRWREDPTRDCWGYFIYFRDVETGRFWSAAYQPTLHQTKQYEAVFGQGRAEFRQSHLGLLINTEIGVSPEDDVELRRITITNLSRKVRTIEVTSYAEVVMAPQAADASHRAFSNLFVQTEFDVPTSAILCTRRARSNMEQPPFMLHLLVGQGGEQGPVSCETDRARFIGRHADLTRPEAILSDEPLSGTTGSVLDPIVSLRRRVAIKPGDKATLVYVLGIGENREAASALILKYGNIRMADRAFDLAWTHSQVSLRQLNATEAEAQVYSRLASALIYADPAYRAEANTLRRNRRGQSALWAYGISGDVPIVLLRIGSTAHMELVEQLVKAHSYWRMKGLRVELVIVNEDVSDYRQSLQDAIISSIMLGMGATMIDRPEGIFVRRHEQIADENLILLRSVARIVFDAEHGPLQAQMMNAVQPSIPIRGSSPSFHPSGASTARSALPTRELILENGFGGFTPDGKEYVITLQPGQVTPAPWVNVIANPFFGTMISESGSSFTWLENAKQFPLTPWNNDPVADEGGEAFYIRDEETGKFWSPTPMPTRGTTPYVIRHGFGYSVFEHTEDGIASELWIYVAMDAPVKFAVLKLRNLSDRPRQISATAYYEWVLAEVRESGLMHAQTEIDQRTGALLARNSYSAEFPNRIAFVDVNEESTIAGDRRNFIGRNGTLARPAALRKKELPGSVGAGLDPCGAVAVPIRLREGEERELTFRLGVGEDSSDVHQLIQRFRQPGASRAALEGVWDHWRQVLGAVHVQTPDPAVNVMANGWLLYQTLSSRMWGRTGFYQAGGAFGFRDQLQDSMALVHAAPQLVRDHLLLAASRQFQQGDVQHWWHPPVGRGVRTHFSDDFLWLPFVTCHYVSATGDTGVLEESVPFLEGRAVGEDEEAYYDLPMRSQENASLYQHCVRAIENGMRYGTHGMPLMGCGDWNDGMNRIGEGGRGESVWLGFFQYAVLRQFAELAEQHNDQAFAEKCRAQAAILQRDLEKNTWDGSWYIRAYFDNGDPVGSHASAECQIDSLPQSWSVISGAASTERARIAMESVDRRLVRRDEQLIQLFDPPFDQSPADPGYIKGYIPGIRENGGQYTHAAIWTVMGFALLGDHDRAWKLFDLLNPVNHSSTEEGAKIYKVEPYVVAADVYARPPHVGRGGWTWYTGSAGWMYRLLIETLLGVSRQGDFLSIKPRLPSKWNTVVIHYRHKRTTYQITITRTAPQETAVPLLTSDGTVLPDNKIPLVDEPRVISVQMAL